MGYLKDSIKGLSWMSAFRVVYRLLGVVRIAILARLLTPAQFGVVGIATLVLGFLEIFTETGINIFLIQETEDINPFINTSWVVSIVRGGIISLVLLIAAWPISVFFNSPGSLNLLLLISIVPLIRGFINPSIVKLQKNLAFNKEFLYRSLVFLVEVTFSIVLTLITRNPISLIWGLVISALFEVFYTHTIVNPKPLFKFDKLKFKKVLGRGIWVTGFGIFDYLYTQSDNIIVAKLLGQAALGIYDNAYTISTAPLTEVGDVFFRVTFPVFSKISGDLNRLKSAFLKNTIVNSLLMIPAGIVIYIFADLIVRILLGPAWLAAIPVVKILSILGVVRGIANSTNSLLVSTQNQKFSAITTLVSTIGLWISIFPLVHLYGILGAAAAAIFGTLISLPFTFYFVNKTLKSGNV